MGENTTKNRGGRPKATTNAADNYISDQLAWQKADCSKHPCITESMLWKNVPTPSVRRRLCEADPYGRIAVNNALLR